MLFIIIITIITLLLYVYIFDIRHIELFIIYTDVKLELTGSVRDGFALKESDTNIQIVAPKDANFLTVFTEIHKTLQTNGTGFS